MKPIVAIQGIKASFHEEAAHKFFGDEAVILECRNFSDTCKILAEGRCDFVVMAIENSIAGSLLGNYTLIHDNNFFIAGEVVLPINLHLMALPGVTRKDITRIISHPIAIRQCNDYLEKLEGVAVIEQADTAGCARDIYEKDLLDTAAIANYAAAKLYQLEIVEKSIQIHKKNFTRFLILQKAPAYNTTFNKSSFCFETRHTVGALSRVLAVFAEYGGNLSKIQSMPVIGKPTEYHFYVDVEWDDTSGYSEALKNVLKDARNFNIMGEYMKNDTYE